MRRRIRNKREGEIEGGGIGSREEEDARVSLS